MNVHPSACKEIDGRSVSTCGRSLGAFICRLSVQVQACMSLAFLVRVTVFLTLRHNNMSVFLCVCVYICGVARCKSVSVIFFFLPSQSQSILHSLVGREPLLSVRALNELVGGWITPL